MLSQIPGKYTQFNYGTAFFLFKLFSLNYAGTRANIKWLKHGTFLVGLMLTPVLISRRVLCPGTTAPDKERHTSAQQEFNFCLWHITWSTFLSLWMTDGFLVAVSQMRVRQIQDFQAHLPRSSSIMPPQFYVILSLLSGGLITTLLIVWEENSVWTLTSVRYVRRYQ